MYKALQFCNKLHQEKKWLINNGISLSEFPEFKVYKAKIAKFKLKYLGDLVKVDMEIQKMIKTKSDGKTDEQKREEDLENERQFLMAKQLEEYARAK